MCCVGTGFCAGAPHAGRLGTEAIVVLADLLISRDMAALRGRIAGWHAARARPRLELPPAESVDASIGFRDSLARRWQVYA